MWISQHTTINNDIIKIIVITSIVQRCSIVNGYTILNFCYFHIVCIRQATIIHTPIIVFGTVNTINTCLYSFSHVSFYSISNFISHSVLNVIFNLFKDRFTI